MVAYFPLDRSNVFISAATLLIKRIIAISWGKPQFRERDISAFARTNHLLYSLLNTHLYRHMYYYLEVLRYYGLQNMGKR
jgi:hypothetical protein